MCGRFALSVKTTDIEKLLPSIKRTESLGQARYNIAPSQNIATILNTIPDEISFLKWGLILFWAKDANIGSKMINAKAETLAEKPSFKNSLRKKRCIIPASGFYEWQKVPGQKIKSPFYIKMKDNAPFFFAGLWDEWKNPENGIVKTVSIITTSANEIMSPIHNRMPVILDSNFLRLWLSEEQSGLKELQEGLNPFPSEKMIASKYQL